MKCTQCGNEFEGNFCPKCGATSADNTAKMAEGETVAEQTVQAQPAQFAPVLTAAKSYKDAPASVFTGTVLGYFFVNLAVFFGTLFTLGIAYPWLRCFQQRYIANHTYIHGCRQTFDGTGGQLFGNYVKWWLLSIVTFGIYGFWLNIKMQQWLVKHTHFAGVEGGESHFDGGIGGYIGTHLLAGLASCTFFMIPWALCFIQKWYARNTFIDGYQQQFDGRAGQLFGKFLLWGLLTVVTFGIYSLWLTVSVQCWLTKHTVSPMLANSPALNAMCCADPKKESKFRDGEVEGYDGLREDIKNDKALMLNAVSPQHTYAKMTVPSVIFVVVYLLVAIIVGIVLSVDQSASSSSDVSGGIGAYVPVIVCTLIVCTIPSTLMLICVRKPNKNTTIKQLESNKKLLTFAAVVTSLFSFYGLFASVPYWIQCQRMQSQINFYKALYAKDGKDGKEPLGDAFIQIQYANNYNVAEREGLLQQAEQAQPVEQVEQVEQAEQPVETEQAESAE